MVQQIMRRLSCGAEAQGLSAVQLRAERARAASRAQTLGPVYVVHGDEPLIALEAADAVRAAARERGFTDREVLEPGSGFDWSALAHSLAQPVAVRRKKIVELRLPAASPAPQGGEAIARYCASVPAPIFLLWSRCRARPHDASTSAGSAPSSSAGVVVDVAGRARTPAGVDRRAPRPPGDSAPRARRSSSSPRASRATCSPRTRKCRSWRCSPRRASSALERGARRRSANVARYDAQTPRARRCSAATPRATCGSSTA